MAEPPANAVATNAGYEPVAGENAADLANESADRAAAAPEASPTAQKPARSLWKFLRRPFVADFLAVLVSALLHVGLLFLCLVIYLSVSRQERGPGFTAGVGSMGQPLEFQTIEGLDTELNLENAMAFDPVAALDRVEVDRPVPEPEVTLRQPEVRPDLAGASKPLDFKLSLEALVERQWSKSALSSRSPGAKAALLKSEGGTPESEKAVGRGLEWLAAHQADDGSWSLNPAGVCGNAACGSARAESRETATALALLPFFGAGHFPGEEGPYRKGIDRALSWLQSRVDKSGRVIPDNAPTHFHMYAHAIVTIALCEATALKPGGKWAPAARRAAQYIVDAQNPRDGGWRYSPGQAGDTSVFGWQLMALRSARIAGMKVPKSTMTLARRWLNLARAATDDSLYAYMPGLPPSPVMTAEALLCRQLLADGPKSRGMALGTSNVLSHLTSSLDSRNYYYWYYATQLMHNAGGKSWSRWNPLIREKLIAEQRTAPGHAAGSWQPEDPADDRWGRTGGPIMQTALGLLTLEVYYRFLPMYKVRPEADQSADATLDREAGD